MKKSLVLALSLLLFTSNTMHANDWPWISLYKRLATYLHSFVESDGTQSNNKIVQMEALFRQRTASEQRLNVLRNTILSISTETSLSKNVSRVVGGGSATIGALFIVGGLRIVKNIANKNLPCDQNWLTYVALFTSGGIYAVRTGLNRMIPEKTENLTKKLQEESNNFKIIHDHAFELNKNDDVRKNFPDKQHLLTTALATN